jgi:hypothetical protein
MMVFPNWSPHLSVQPTAVRFCKIWTRKGARSEGQKQQEALLGMMNQCMKVIEVLKRSRPPFCSLGLELPPRATLI